MSILHMRFVPNPSKLPTWRVVPTWHQKVQKVNVVVPCKGIGQSKMKILSSFTQSHAVPNLYDVLFSVEHGRYIYIYIYIYILHTYKLMVLFGYQYSSKYLLVFYRRRHTGLERHDGE